MKIKCYLLLYKAVILHLLLNKITQSENRLLGIVFGSKGRK